MRSRCWMHGADAGSMRIWKLGLCMELSLPCRYPCPDQAPIGRQARSSNIITYDASTSSFVVCGVDRFQYSTSYRVVRSLTSRWNEMKIVRSLKDHKHPAIIAFHSFIITPSYALITM